MPTRWRTSFHSAKTNQGRQDEGIQNKRLFVVPRAVPGLLLRCEARGLPRVQAIGSSTPSPTSIKTACNGRNAHPCCNFFFFFSGDAATSKVPRRTHARRPIYADAKHEILTSSRHLRFLEPIPPEGTQQRRNLLCGRTPQPRVKSWRNY